MIYSVINISQDAVEDFEQRIVNVARIVNMNLFEFIKTAIKQANLHRMLRHLGDKSLRI